METIEQKLDALAEYHSQKDSIDEKKRALLDEVKVPAEVLKLQDEAQKEAQKAGAFQRALIENLRRECAAKLEEIVIPAEIKKQLESIDIQRNIVLSYMTAKENEYKEAAAKRGAEIHAAAQAQTAQVYADLAQRKKEIESEFFGKTQAVDENIKALEAEIREKTKAAKHTVKGKYFSAIYVKGRVTWNTESLDKYADQHPEVAYFRKEGEPSITLRKV